MTSTPLPEHAGVLGSGIVGRVLAAGLAGHGIACVLGTRRTDDAELVAWSKESGVPIVSFAEAAAFGDTVVLAVRGASQALGGVLDAAGGPEAFAGKVVIDVTNPLVFGEGGPSLESADASGGEALQRRLPAAKVVKAFNTVGNALMVDPQIEGGPPVMFIAGDDDGAVACVGAILEAFGWRWLRVGGIDRSRELESLCILWVAIGQQKGSWSHAFTLLEA
jgi:8-hydroxy-5-deazaflavin:NADPH oxidoreductase